MVELTIKLEDEEYRVLCRVAMESSLPPEELVTALIISGNQSWVMSVTNPEMMMEMINTEAGRILTKGYSDAQGQIREG